METIKELNMKELDQVTGGDSISICAVIGFSDHKTSNACAFVGTGTENEGWGLGFTACAYVGFGMGGVGTDPEDSKK